MKILICILLALAIGFYSGFTIKDAIASGEVSPEQKQLIYFHAWAKGQHQFYIDHPRLQNVYTGNTSINQWCVEMYQRTLEYITGGQVITGQKGTNEIEELLR